MQVKVEYSLPPVRAGIDYDAITPFMNLFLCCDLTGNYEHMPDQGFIVIE
jgi:hypothetical protein